MYAALLVGFLLAGKPSPIPSGVALTQAAVVRLAIPDVEAKLRRAKAPACTSDPQCTYRASVEAARRSNLGIAGRDFLVALVHEVEYECTACHRAVLVVIDLRSRQALFVYSVEGFPSSISFKEPLGPPWPISVSFGVGANHMAPGANVVVIPTVAPDGTVSFKAGPVLLAPASSEPGA